jgi:CSLREA domain-containing protein
VPAHRASQLPSGHALCASYRGCLTNDEFLLGRCVFVIRPGKFVAVKLAPSLRLLTGTILLWVAALALSAGTRTKTLSPTAFGILYVVDSTGDGDNVPLNSIGCDDGTGHCTLRAAIEAANAHSGVADTIHFNIPTSDPGYNGTSWIINLGTALPDVSDSVTITGPGADKLVVHRNSSTQFRIFNVTATGTVSFSGLTIAGGSAPSNGSGGGIQNASTATVNLTNVTITNNSAVQGGGINNHGTLTITNSTISGNSGSFSQAGGGIYNNGTLTVTSSTISGNTSPSGDGAGIFNSFGGSSGSGTATISNSTITNNTAHGNGGGIDNQFGSTVTVTNSMITNNSAQIGSGGGILGGVNVMNSTISGNSALQGGGINSAGGTVNVTSSTISSNTGSSSQAGGGIWNSGTLSVTNSTISGNTSPSGDGGGIFNTNAINSSSTVTITSSTITNNTAHGNGGGIDNQFGSTFNVRSSIIALNTAAGSGPDGFSTFTSGGFNLIGKKDGSAGFTAATDQTGTIASPLNPKLDPAGLQDNGGPTKTVALLSGSPAIDKGDDSVFGPAPGLQDDQRGYPRKIGAHVDVGAFEYEFGDRLRIISIARSGSNIVVTFQAIQGATYRLERTPSLSPPNWQSISGVADLTASGNGPAQITDTTSPISLGRAFYRVALLP